ncbi:hypothetical protein AMECASPLE_030999 [Ameca splendens]|uniref:Uncharacterized protein n=1 Tax=Ameca splendens TaxID=208324 RepID=A0ABV0ZRR7_9TELE
MKKEGVSVELALQGRSVTRVRLASTHWVLAAAEFPAETLSLQRRVEQFSRSEGKTTGRITGYSCNVQLGRLTEQAAPPNSYGG